MLSGPPFTILISLPPASRAAKVNWQDTVAPEGFTHAGILSGEGKGGPAGFARGQSEVRLAEDEENTVLTYSAKATVGGKLAQIGQRLIDSTAKSIANNFFASFEALMRAGGKAAAGDAPATIPADAKPEKTRIEEGLKPQIWVVGLIATVVLLLILFGIAL
jgi:carbon monoxide dehydrogenase subunit G